MIISSSFSCLLFHWRCFNVSLFRQCSIIVLRCSAVFRLFRRCSIVPVLFRCSGVVLSFSGVPCSVVPVVFQWCSVVPSFRRCSVFQCSWFYSMPFHWPKYCRYLNYYSSNLENHSLLCHL